MPYEEHTVDFMGNTVGEPYMRYTQADYDKVCADRDTLREQEWALRQALEDAPEAVYNASTEWVHAYSEWHEGPRQAALSQEP